MPIGNLLSRRRERGADGDPLLSVTQDRGVIPQAIAGRRDTSSANKTSYWRVYPNDIVYNTMRMWQGASSRSDYFGIVSPAYTVCRPEPEASGRFLAYALKLPEHIRLFRGRSQGLTSDVWNLRFDEFAKIRLRFVPDYLEQEKIADILSSVDDAIERTRAVIDQVQVVKRGLMQKLLTRGLPGQHMQFKRTETGEVPEEWTFVPLGTLAASNRGLQTGPFGSQLHASDYVTHGVPVVMPKDIVHGYVSRESPARIPHEKAEELSRHRVQEGDLLFARRGDLGRVGLISRREVGWLCGTGCIRFRPREPDISRYLRQWMTWPPTVRWLNENAVGQTMLNLNTAILSRLPVALPDESERSLIVGVLEAPETQIGALRREIEGLRKTKQALMSVLLTGELRVTPKPE